MNLLDRDVFAVLLALVVVATFFSLALMLRPHEHFLLATLLNANCSIGTYPRAVVNGGNITLCLYLENHLGEPIYVQIRYKIGTNETLPTNSTPSPEPTLKTFETILEDRANVTLRMVVPVYVKPSLVGQRIALIFEVWIYDVDNDSWKYTGIWLHHYVKVYEVGTP